MQNNEIQYSVIGGKLKVSQIKHFLHSSYGKKNDLQNHDGYLVDKDLSGSRFQAYYHPEKEHLVTVHRGTSGIQDMITDLRYALNNKSNKRFQHAKNQQQKAEQKYTNSKTVSVLGHSLGAELASHANNHNKKNEVITLNGAVNIQDSLKKQPENHYNIKTSLDPVSILQNKNKNQTIIPSNNMNLLKEHSTSTLDRINQNAEIGGMICKSKTNHIIPTNDDFSNIGVESSSNSNSKKIKQKPTQNKKYSKTKTNELNYTSQQIMQELNDENQTANGLLNFFKQLPFYQQQEFHSAFTEKYHELKEIHGGGNGNITQNSNIYKE